MSGQQHAPAALYPRERPGTHFTYTHTHTHTQTHTYIYTGYIYIYIYIQRERHTPQFVTTGSVYIVFSFNAV